MVILRHPRKEVNYLQKVTRPKRTSSLGRSSSPKQPASKQHVSKRKKTEGLPSKPKPKEGRNEEELPRGLKTVVKLEEHFQKLGCKLTRSLDSKLGRLAASKLKDIVSQPLKEKSFLEAISTGQLRGCTLMSEEGNEYAVTVVAEKNIKQGECIVAYMGNLWSKQDFDEFIGSPNDLKHLWAYDVPSEFLPGYKGPELIVEAIDCGNEARFLKDHRVDHDAHEANVESTIVWDDNSKLPYVVFCATRNIKKGEEILLDWGEETWENVLRIHKTSPKNFNLWSQELLGTNHSSSSDEDSDGDSGEDIESDDDAETLFMLKTPLPDALVT